MLEVPVLDKSFEGIEFEFLTAITKNGNVCAIVGSEADGLVWFLCLMAYQSHSPRRTVVVLFNP